MCFLIIKILSNKNDTARRLHYKAYFLVNSAVIAAPLKQHIVRFKNIIFKFNFQRKSNVQIKIRQISEAVKPQQPQSWNKIGISSSFCFVIRFFNKKKQKQWNIQNKKTRKYSAFSCGFAYFKVANFHMIALCVNVILFFKDGITLGR